MSYSKLNRAFLTLLAVATAISPAARALDLTPEESSRQLEGFRLPVLIFTDADCKIRYRPPAKWTYNGDAKTLLFYPPDLQEAFVKWQVLPRAATTANEDLLKWSQGLLPADAKEIALVADNPSPFVLDGKPSREWIYTYVGGGRRFQTAVAVCDLDEKQRFLVVITARTSDFKTVHEAGITSLFSWNRQK